MCQLMKKANPVEVSAQRLVKHTKGRSDHEDDACPTEKDCVAFGNVHVAERFGPTAACGAALDQFPAPLEGEAQKETSKSKEEAGRYGMTLECSGSSHI